MTQQPATGPLPSPQPSPYQAGPYQPVPHQLGPSPYPAGPYPQGPFPLPPGPGVVPPAARWELERVDPLPGTEFGLVHLRVPPIASGLAIGSLVAGIGAILASLLVFCFGLVGAEPGWGGLVSGAFTLLSVAIGGGAVAVGVVARRQIRRAGEPGHVRFTGGGMAMAGIVCGSIGAGIALLSLVLALMLQV